MHGMLSAVIIMIAFLAVAAAAGMVAVKVYRGGPHDG